LSTSPSTQVPGLPSVSIRPTNGAVAATDCTLPVTAKPLPLGDSPGNLVDTERPGCEHSVLPQGVRNMTRRAGRTRSTPAPQGTQGPRISRTSRKKGRRRKTPRGTGEGSLGHPFPPMVDRGTGLENPLGGSAILGELRLPFLCVPGLPSRPSRPRRRLSTSSTTSPSKEGANNPLT
jgi:hypothetical protein